MNDLQRYEFDRQGFLVIENMLTAVQVASLAAAVDALEEHAVAGLDDPPRKRSPWGPDYHRDPDLGYHVQGSRQEGSTVIIEDFWNADPAFDLLIGHQPAMDSVSSVIQGRATINNSEIRIRYRGNQSANHGGTRSAKYRYHVNRNGIDCMMVRMVYFLHDVSNENRERSASSRGPTRATSTAPTTPTIPMSSPAWSVYRSRPATPSSSPKRCATAG